MAIQQARATQVAVRLTSSELEHIESFVQAGLYRSNADFVREAVRDKLRAMEPTGVRAVSAKQAERLILAYLHREPGRHFASEIADVIGLDYGTVFRTIRRLLDAGKVRRSTNPPP